MFFFIIKQLYTNIIENYKHASALFIIDGAKRLNFVDFGRNKYWLILIKRAYTKISQQAENFINQGLAGSWCSRAKFQVSKFSAGRSFNFSDI